MLQADGAYWFKQISAPKGYEPMQEESVALEMDLDKGVISAMTDTEHPNEVRLAQVINRRQGAKPTPHPHPHPCPARSPHPGPAHGRRYAAVVMGRAGAGMRRCGHSAGPAA